MTLGGGSQSEAALQAEKKRRAQLDRWRGSDTEKESVEIKSRPKRVKFADKYIFQAACAANDKSQVSRMIKKGYNINTVDEDGITALHHACIEDNFEMAEFLLQNGADVNIGDNEGWTPLHAVATCCYVSIAKLLLEHGADVVAINSECNVPLDICKSEEIKELFIQEINAKGIDLKDARRAEELRMLEDAKRWVDSGIPEEVVHSSTGATALHVAACKGYIKVLDLLIKAGGNVDAQDVDGWTPLHAAAHWGQVEACEVLLENMCDMGIRNNCDQTALDIADDSVIGVLQQWKKRHDVNKNIDSKQQSLNNNNNNVAPVGKKKATAQRPDSSAPPTDQDVTIVTSHLGQGDAVSNKSAEPSNSISDQVSVNESVQETGHDRVTKGVDEEAEDTLSELPSTTTPETGASLTTPLEPISFVHSQPEDPSEASTTSSQPANTSTTMTVSTTTPPPKPSSTAPTNQNLSSSRAISSSSDKSSDRTIPETDPLPSQTDFEPTAPRIWKRGGSLRTRSTLTTGTSPLTSSSSTAVGQDETSTASVSGNKGGMERPTVRRTQSAATAADSSLRRAYSFESDAKFYSRLKDARERIKAMEDSSPLITSSSPSDSLSSSVTSALTATTTTMVTPAGSVGTPSTYLSTRSSSSSTSDGFTSSSSLSRPYLRSSGLTSLTSTNPMGTTSSTGRSVGGPPPTTNSASDSNHAISITTTAPSSIESSCVNSSGSHRETLESPLSQEEDDLFLPVILRRGSRGDQRPNALGSPNPSSRATSNTSTTSLPTTTTSSLPQNYSENKHTRRSFVPPVRDEQSEMQRKAHAKRVRETRRSTQGVTLEELKSAEQYVKNSQTGGENNASGSTNPSAVPVSSSGRKEQQQQLEDINVERRPSWRLRVDEQDRSKFSLEDTRQQTGAGSSAGTSSGGTLAANTSVPTSRSGGYHSEIPYGLAQRNPSLRSKLGKGMHIDQTMLANAGISSGHQSNSSGASSSTPQGKPPLPPGGEPESTSSHHQEDDKDVRNSSGAEGAILRKKKTKRRSTGVVQFNADATCPQDPQDSVPSDSEIGREASSDVEGESKSENGVTQRINYRKLYEEVLKENQVLKSKLSRAEEDIAELKLKLDKISMTPRITSDDTEKMEKRALERKLSEMEEELKEIRHLKSENQKLRDENGALIRVISKLSK